MSRFYQDLLGKRSGLDKPPPKAEALREAKAWLRGLTAQDISAQVAGLPQVRGTERAKPAAAKPAKRPFAHLYYWSAFILVGDPN